MRRRFTPRHVCLFLAFVLVGSSCAAFTDLPRVKKKHLKHKIKPQTSKIFAGNGKLITTVHGAQNRTVVPIEEVPDHVKQAVIAIEDERFYEHDGVDVKGIARAAVHNFASDGALQGGSTITQQYVKNRIIAPGRKRAERTLERKVDEAALARQLETKLTKDEILGRYMNLVYFGNGAYGIQAASKTYFGKPVWKLSVKQAATLAGLIRSPERYDPYDNPDAGKDRRNLVITKLEELGYIPTEQADKAREYPLGLVKKPKKRKHEAAYFVDYVRRLLVYHPRFSFLGDSPAKRSRRLLRGGLKIYTTVNLKAQRAAEKAVDEVLTKRNDPHAALVSMNPRNGRIKAMVGGRNFFAGRKRDRYARLNLAIGGKPNLGNSAGANRAPGTGRQAGSSFKPFALATALGQGVPLQRTFKAPACEEFPDPYRPEPWKVCNYGGANYGSVSLERATTSSINVAYAKLILDVGPKEVVKHARGMGIRSTLAPVPSAVLGTNPVNPLDMATAYGTLAAMGKRHRPVAVRAIVDADGEVIYKDDSSPTRVLDKGVAYLTNRVLQDVITGGTGTAAQIGRPAAGKTGTAQEYRDAWFAGYTPNHVATVWVGYPSASIEMKTSCGNKERSVCRPTRITVAGGTWPAMIWQNYMKRAVRRLGLKPKSFPRPGKRLDEVIVDTRTGCLASGFTPGNFKQETVVVRGSLPPADAKRCREQEAADRAAAAAAAARAAEAEKEKNKDKENGSNGNGGSGDGGSDNGGSSGENPGGSGDGSGDND